MLDRHVRKDVFQVTVYLLRQACNVPIKQMAGLGKVSVPRISQIQRQIEDIGGLGHTFQRAEKLEKYISENISDQYKDLIKENYNDDPLVVLKLIRDDLLIRYSKGREKEKKTGKPCKTVTDTANAIRQITESIENMESSRGSNSISILDLIKDTNNKKFSRETVKKFNENLFRIESPLTDFENINE